MIYTRGENDRDRILWLVSVAIVCHATYLPTSSQGRPRYELSYRGNLRQPFEYKTVLTKNDNYVQKPTVELAQWSYGSFVLSHRYDYES